MTKRAFKITSSCKYFSRGCNFKCPFCQNSSLIPLNGEENYDEDELFSDLELRKNVLDGVVITGGEPLIHEDILLFIKRIKKLGLKVKIDTNGSNPKLLQTLIEKKLVDYIAMDIKNIYSKYAITIGKNTNFKS